MKLPRLSAAAIAGLIAILLPAAPLAAQEGNQLDGDIRLFTVLTALNVAGYDQGLGSPSDSPVRQAIREDLKDFDGSSLTLLKNFYQQFKLDDPGENLSQYISFALIAGPPPDFEIRAELPTDLPPDVRQLRPLSGILSEFYHQAGIEKLWNKHQPQIEQEILRYSDPLISALFEAGGYLRVSPSSPMRSRSRRATRSSGATSRCSPTPSHSIPRSPTISAMPACPRVPAPSVPVPSHPARYSAIPSPSRALIGISASRMRATTCSAS